MSASKAVLIACSDLEKDFIAWSGFSCAREAIFASDVHCAVFIVNISKSNLVRLKLLAILPHSSSSEVKTPLLPVRRPESSLTVRSMTLQLSLSIQDTMLQILAKSRLDASGGGYWMYRVQSRVICSVLDELRGQLKNIKGIFSGRRAKRTTDFDNWQFKWQIYELILPNSVFAEPKMEPQMPADPRAV